MAPVFAAIGTAFSGIGAAIGGGVAAGGVATAAGGLFAGGGLGIVGGILGGIGQGLMMKQEYKAEREAEEAARKRVEDSYIGAGDATGVWNKPVEGDKAASTNQFERVNPMSNADLRVGKRETRALPGQQFQMSTPPPQQAAGYKYNPQTRRIERQGM